MYIDISYKRTSKRIYKSVLLRTSYREGKKVKHRTIANLSQCSDEEIEAIRFALKHKGKLPNLNDTDTVPNITFGLSVGAIFVLSTIAKRLGFQKILGNDKQGKLALWMILARIIGQGSRLSAVRLAMQHAVCGILNMDNFREEELYRNLDWLSANQNNIEKKLTHYKNTDNQLSLFLYDVTSSYLEGKCNEYASYGYNRDGKKGKKQIVVGLLTDCSGDPVSVQVFKGNTKDTKTFADQVHKVSERFGIKKNYICW